MEVLLSKEHYYFQIHINILMKNSAYLPSILGNPLIFTRKSRPCPLLYVFKNLSPLKIGVFALINVYAEVFSRIFCPNCEAA